jgi:group I intron endonuclease
MGARNNEIPIVYVVTNTVNGHQYVGITRRLLRRRWCAHLRSARKGVKTALYDAIRKYGHEAFTVQEIACALSVHSLGNLESAMIISLRTRAPNGYNLTDGGYGVAGIDPETRRRITQGNIGRKHTPEARRLIGLASKGHKVSTETRAAISAAHKGKSLSTDHRSKLAAAKRGRQQPARSAQHCQRISAGLIAAHARKRRKPQ